MGEQMTDLLNHDLEAMGSSMFRRDENWLGPKPAETCPMEMIFHWGNCEYILVMSWIVTEVGKFVGVAVLIGLIAVLYEGLKYLREKLHIDAQGAEMKAHEQNCSAKTIRKQILNKMHFIQTMLHLVQVAVSYLLMLIVMTYNIWLFLAVVVGASTGYIIFGWLRGSAVDITEHCH